MYEDDKALVRKAFVTGTVAKASKVKSEPEPAQGPGKPGGPWQVTLKPADYSIHPGDTVEYLVQLDDGPALLEAELFEPQLFFRTDEQAVHRYVAAVRAALE